MGPRRGRDRQGSRRSVRRRGALPVRLARSDGCCDGHPWHGRRHGRCGELHDHPAGLANQRDRLTLRRVHDSIEPGADDTPDEAAVRREIRPWMDRHAARYGRSRGPRRIGDTPEFVAASRAWQRELDDGGWGAVTWPEAFGGRAYGPNEARIFREEEQRYAVATGAQHTSVAMVGPTIIAHGTDEQHERFIGPIRRGETLYCQLFSEPDAGSDLASLRTRAERDGDE